jgi:hypothetical protein
MPAIAFDTLKFANKLKEAGVPDKQAEAQAATMAEALQVNLESLATKEQVDRQGADVRKEIELLRSDMNREIRLVRQENDQNKNELLQAISHNETRQNGQIQLLRWMVTASLALMTGLFIRIMFFRIN